MYASTPAAESAGTPPAGVASEDDHHGGHADVAYLYNPQPDYPFAARRLHLEGSVVLRVLVDQTGSPGAIGIEHSSGVAPLDEAALAKVRTWRFTPAMEGSAPIAHWVDIPIRFRLED